MTEWLRLYGTYVRLFFKSRAEYRASFFWGIAANFYCYFITYALIWFLLQRFKSIDGWVFNDISILYSLNLLTYAISGTLFWNTIFFLDQQIINGTLDRLFLRPMGLISQLVCQGFGYTFLGQILVSGLFLIGALEEAIADWSIPKIGYLVAVIGGGVLLQGAGLIFTGSLSFWMQRSTEIGNIVYYDLRQFIHYPLSVYPKALQYLLTFIFPWAFINYYPSLILLDKSASTWHLSLGWVAPLVGGVAFGGAWLLFQTGVKRYTSTGN